MDTPAQRSAWIETVINGRTVGSGLSPFDQPDVSIGTVALKEALRAFVGGLFLSTVLDAYAAVEIMMVDRVVIGRTALLASEGGMSADALTRGWAVAVEEKADLARTKAILDEYPAVGLWMHPDLRRRILDLGRHKNDFAHFRKWGPAQFTQDDSGSTFGTLERSEIVRPETRRRLCGARSESHP
jgi:hypothetical protein